MSEGGEKTELPTPKKERDARQKGQVARSQEVVTTLSLFGVLLTIWALGENMWLRMVLLMDIVAGLAVVNDNTSMQVGLAAVYDELVATLIPIIGVTILLGIAANYIQIGSLFSFESITPKLEKISITKGFKRIFSMKQVVEMLKSIFKIIFLSVLLYLVLEAAIRPYLLSVECGMICITSLTVSVMWQVMIYSALAFVIVSCFDFMYQKHTHIKSLKMSKDEVKREYKESEGDPIVKGQRKQLAQELVMSDVKKQVPKSSAVVVNPVHLAVAIRYKEGETPLPIVVAKGREKIAYQIRAEAETSGVPVFRNIPLTRQLYADCAVDDYIPDDVFGVIAEILAWIKRHEETLYNGRLSHGDLDMENNDHKPKKDEVYVN